MVEDSPTAPDAIVVNLSQLFYHTVWSHGGNMFDQIVSLMACMPLVDATQYHIIWPRRKSALSTHARRGLPKKAM